MHCKIYKQLANQVSKSINCGGIDGADLKSVSCARDYMHRRTFSSRCSLSTLHWLQNTMVNVTCHFKEFLSSAAHPSRGLATPD